MRMDNYRSHRTTNESSDAANKVGTQPSLIEPRVLKRR